jgi:hypothetical protein
MPTTEPRRPVALAERTAVETRTAAIPRGDLDTRTAVHDLVVAFYREIVFDDLLAPLFEERRSHRCADLTPAARRRPQRRRGDVRGRHTMTSPCTISSPRLRRESVTVRC